MLTLAQSKANKKALLKEIERDQRRKDRALLESLRNQINAAKQHLKTERAKAVERCRNERQALKARLKQKRVALLAQLREAEKQERLAARGSCSLDKQKATNEAREALERLKTERKERRSTIRLLRRSTSKKSSTTAKEKRQESDDEVRSNIPADLLPLFEKIKGKIKGSEKKSRSEAFLEYAESHPSEVLEAQENEAESSLNELIAQYYKQQKAIKSPRRYSKKRLESLSEVPFLCLLNVCTHFLRFDT